MKLVRVAAFLPGVFLILSIPAVEAQFNPGPNPITGTVTAAQTIGSGTGTVAAAGTLQVSGSSVAITVSGSSTIVNDGTIMQTGTGRGIRDNTGGLTLVVNNNANALLQTADADAIQMNKSNSSITFNNYGSVISLNASAGGSQAIDWNAITTGSNVLHNYSTGLIEAFEADAVRPGINGVVTNEGTIKAVTSTGSSSDWIDAQNNSGVTVTNSGAGLIEGGRHGITGGAVNNSVSFTMGITNGVGATIQGDDGSGINIDGFNANEVVTISNDGNITGNGVTGDGDGVDVDGVVNLTNTGTIKSLNAFSAVPGGASEGVTVGGGTIVNSGTIEGDVVNGNVNAVGRGITLAGVDTSGTPEPIYANSVVTNSGLIKGQTDSGIAVLGAASGYTVTINNNAGGVIEGGGATAAAIQTGADSDTVNNAGQIIADSSGTAVDLGAGDDALNITGGSASIIGDVSGGSGTNTLTIDPGSGHSFSYAGSISNFSSAEIKSGTVTLSGASTYSGNTTISGGTLVAHNLSGSATGTGAVTVESGATLAGDGRIGGDVTLQGGGIIAPGLSPGNLNLDSNLTITGGSRFAFELGPQSDLLIVAGSLTFSSSGQAFFDISNAGLVAGSDYTLIDFASPSNLTLGDLALGNTPAGFSGTLSLTSDAIILHVVDVPEPAGFWIFGVGAAVLAGLLRKRVAKEPASRLV
ncbi:MAG: beta strand repeat-containing protein [Chthoniobacterales bacterium]